MTRDEIRGALEFAKLTRLMGGTVMTEDKLIEVVEKIIDEVERYHEALTEMSESDDPWYVGRIPMQEYATRALREPG